MNERRTRRDNLPSPSEHLPALTLEQLAEESLPPAEAIGARRHLEACGRCSAELEAFRALFTALEGLPRFAPSAAFADAVMARVQVAPAESALPSWLMRLIPTTRRGWVMVGLAVTAPALPMIALVLWLLTQPLLSPITLGQWVVLQTQSAAQAGLAWLLDRAIGSMLFNLGEATLTTIQTVPSSALGGALALLAVAIPLSAWGLVRLTRTPVGSVTYAN